MNETSDQTVTSDDQHRLRMLLWQAHIHEENGKKQEAAKIRGWVAHFVARQEGNGTWPVQGDFVKP
jgi:hypothetical protein